MKNQDKKLPYRAGDYGKKRMSAAQWTDTTVKKWNSEQAARQAQVKTDYPFPAITFSRQIGVGALEIADLLAAEISYRVADRDILEHMVADANLAKHVIEVYDERYQGPMREILANILSRKTFAISDFSRQLMKTVTALALTEPTIFVGRGAHLMLPRESVLAVRLIGSETFRASRLSGLMNISIADAAAYIREMDKEQDQFFKAVFGRECDAPEEFDLVINQDFIGDPHDAAAIVAGAFHRKFAKK